MIEVPKVLWTDIGGQDETKQKLKEARKELEKEKADRIKAEEALRKSTASTSESTSPINVPNLGGGGSSFIPSISDGGIGGIGGIGGGGGGIGPLFGGGGGSSIPQTPITDNNTLPPVVQPPTTTPQIDTTPLVAPDPSTTILPAVATPVTPLVPDDTTDTPTQNGGRAPIILRPPPTTPVYATPQEIMPAITGYIPRDRCSTVKGCPTVPVIEDNQYDDFGERGPGYWKQVDERGQPLAYGFGYGLWWATQYPWVRRYFPFMRWYALKRWRPYYKVAVSDVNNLRYGTPIPAESLVIDKEYFPLNLLPALPTFAEYDINLSALTRLKGRTINSLYMSDEQAIMGIVREIQTVLDAIKLSAGPYMVAGYIPVPDLDRQAFLWIRDTTKSGLIQSV